MAKGDIQTQTALQAQSPFELRVNLGKTVPDADVRTALAIGRSTGSRRRRMLSSSRRVRHFGRRA